MTDFIPALTLVDIIALSVIAIGGVQGFFRGLSGELARLAGTILAFMAGTLLNEPIGTWVLQNTRLEAQPARTLAFILTIAVAVIIMIILRLLLKKIITLVFAAGFDKTAGVIAGLLRMSIFTCIFFIIMNMVPVESLNRRFGEQSAVGSFMIRYVPTVEKMLEAAGISVFDRDNGDTGTEKP